MKISIYSIAVITTISILLFSCNKDKYPPIKYWNIWDCHHKETWDSSYIEAALIGEWEWEYVSCFWNPDDANDDEFKGLTITFKPDNTLVVKENGRIKQTSHWKIGGIKDNIFEIAVDPPVRQLYGRTLICNDRVKFNNSYIDGCDNYFKKVK